jgi:segregation and condensation protein A
MTTIAPAEPIARLYGAPVLELPQDLYIPPDALEVFLETFEGPLDLLLYLIRRHNLDVLDIPMAELTRQYMQYLEMMQARRLELAAEYLLMAAMLIEIKSRMLLPRPKATREEDEKDPRAELVRKLLEYETIKRAAQRLNALPQAGRDFSLVQVWIDAAVEERLPPQVSAENLRNAWLALLTRAKMREHHKVSREELSVRSHMSRILRVLQGRGFAEFGELFSPQAGVPELVVTFLALLELSREGLIELTQHGAFSPIYASVKHVDLAA